MNVIVIVADSLRQDHVGAYGNDWIHTPNLDAFAAEACRFNHSYPEGFATMPVRTAWFTGRYTFMCRPWQPLLLGDFTLSEALGRSGYTTAFIGDTYHYQSPRFNMLRGFEYTELIRGQEFDKWILDESIKVDVDPYWKDDPKQPERSEKNRGLFHQYQRNVSIRQSEEDYFPGRVTNAAVDYLGRRQKRKDPNDLLLWVEYFDPHEPWDPPQKYRDLYEKEFHCKDLIDPVPALTEGYLAEEELRHVRALYAGEVSLVDAWIGKLFDEIKARGLWDDSLIIVTSDHGHPLGDHGAIKKLIPWLYNELVRTPFIVKHPDGLMAGQSLDAIIQSPDMLPTILDFLDLEMPDSIQGESIIPLMRGEKEKIRDNAYCGFYDSSWAIKNQDWSYLRFMKRRNGKEGPELFDARNDPTEKTNIIDQHPDVAAKLNEELEGFIAKMRSLPPPENSVLPEHWVREN
jgi:arylsulfatase A-like enzyme